MLGSVVLMFVVWFSRRGTNSGELEIWDSDEFDEEELVNISSTEGLDSSEMEEETPEPEVIYEEVELVEED